MSTPARVVPAREVARQDKATALVQAGEVRRNGHAKAIALMGQGTPGRAFHQVMRTWKDRLTVLGLSRAGIPGLPYEQGGDLSW